MAPFIQRISRRFVWAAGMSVLVSAFICFEWLANTAATRARARTVDRANRTNEVVSKLLVYHHRHDLEIAFNHGEPLPCMEIDGPYGRTERVAFDASLLGAQFTGWGVRYDFHLRWGGSEIRVIPPPPARNGVWGGLAEPQFQLAAIRIRQVLLVLCGAIWLTVAVLIPIAGAYRRRIAAVLIAAGSIALVVWFGDPARTPFWSVPAIGAIPRAALAGVVLGFVVRLLPNGRALTYSDRCHCGYDLTGNASGICPECGQITPAESRRRREAETSSLADKIAQLDVARAGEMDSGDSGPVDQKPVQAAPD